MERDKKPTPRQFAIQGDIFLTMPQLEAVVWFYGKDAKVSEVIQQLTTMPVEARENFMSQLEERFHRPDESQLE